MRKNLLQIILANLFFIPFIVNANPTDTLIIIKGNTANKSFKQIELASYGSYTSDTSQTELMTAAWTCNAIGYPTCNYRALFKYDLSSIPPNSIVDSVKLFLYAQTNSPLGNPGNPMFGTNNASLLQKVTQSWTVQNTGWLNQPTTTATGLKILEQSTNTIQNYVLDITDFAKEWIAKPENNYGMLMRLLDENYYNSMIFNSGLAPDELQPTLKFYGTIIPSEDTCIYLKGDTANNSGFKQIELASYGDYDSDTSQTELMTAAWTCNALGYPTCNYRTLFKYDLSSIAQDATISSAKLFLSAQTNSPLGNPGNPMFGNANVSLLQKVTQSWTVKGTGWLNQPPTSASNQKTLIQSTNTIQNYEIDLTDFVQDWVNHPESNYGMLMKLQNENYYNSMIFNSGRAADNLKPILKICIRKSVLALLLKGFTANAINKSVNLSWYIVDGTSLSSIIVERSFNGRTFSKLTSISAKNITTEVRYNTADNNFTGADTKVYYRLKLVNEDGSYKYSNILLVNLDNNNADVQLMPNPVKDNFQLTFKSENAVKIDISILNALGQTIEKFNYQISEGSNSIIVTPKNNLAAGLYIVRFTLNGELISKKFLKQ